MFLFIEAGCESAARRTNRWHSQTRRICIFRYSKGDTKSRFLQMQTVTVQHPKAIIGRTSG